MRSLCSRTGPMMVLALVVCVMISEADQSKSMSDQRIEGDSYVEVPEPDESNMVIIDAELSRLGAAINEYMTPKPASNIRRKRTMYYSSNKWGYTIPVVFDSSYPDPFYRNVVRRVIRHINSRTCLNLVEETERWDPKNKNWFTENGYKWDSCLKIMTKSGCSANSVGPENGKDVEVKPCYDTRLILHEILHGLGVAHIQESYSASSYISVFMDNVRPEYRFTYRSNNPNTSTKYYDAASTTHYSSGTWSLTGDDTYVCIRPDMCRPDETTSLENVNFEEINERYNCSSKFCSDHKIDCSPGYLALLNHTCSCVCPPEYNASTNCKTLINDAERSLEWPIPLTLIAGGTNFTCPKGFSSTGWISFCGKKPTAQDPSPGPIPVDGTTTHLPVCSKTWPSKNIDWNAIPFGGRYCFIKPEGIPCGGIFSESTIELKSTCDVTSNGSIGDVSIKGRDLTIMLCCSDSDHVDYPIALPNDTPFRLFMAYSCPNFEGMRTYAQALTIIPESINITGTRKKPYGYSWDGGHRFYLCYYEPAVYGCNRDVTLSPSIRSVTITTPGYPKAIPTDTRCFYCFNAPAGSQLRVTFNSYDLSPDDKFRIKRFHKWATPYRMDNDNPWHQFVTETNYLCMEFWSSYKVGNNTGANFTVDLLLDSESCYDKTQNGMDYLGTTNVSEIYEACLDWKDAVDCSDSPVNAQDALNRYYESNYCRNPGGKLLQPWCYVYKNQTSCIKRYCDVCNTKTPVDAVKTSMCAAGISEDPKFCQTAIQRFGCFKSCGMTQAPITTPGSCGRPPVPRDGALMGTRKNSYRVGERAYVRCTTSSVPDNSSRLLMCSQNGWKGPSSACIDCPLGWTINGDRCILFSAEERTRSEAEEFCRSFGRHGTLLQIRGKKAQKLLRKLRKESDSLTAHTWISGFMCKPPATWCYTDSSVEMKFFNWAYDSVTNNISLPNIYMYRESSGSGRDGIWFTDEKDSSSKYTVACQMDRAYGEDKFKTCQAVLNENPHFCKDRKTSNEAALYCTKTCGVNKGARKCKELTSAVYRRTSPSATVGAGDVMTFACKPGYFLTDGDTSRGCGAGGTLLGTEPVCDNDPTAVDVGLELVRARGDTTRSYSAFVLDLPGYRIPISGKITTWYYYCMNNGQIYYAVLRKNGSSYTFIGYNEVNCQKDRAIGYKVPPEQRIQVLAGDLVAVWTPKSYVITSDGCSSVKLMNMPSGQVISVDDFKRKTNYTDKLCIMPSIGYRVEKDKL